MSKIEFLSPCKGEAIRIEEFPDEIISDRAMGDGFGIYLSGNEVVAPFDGEVSVLFPTGHAICLIGDNGLQLMIHIGVDSYQIAGLNKTYVSVGDKVKKGQLLIKTDYKKLKKKTGNTATAIVFLNNEKVELTKVNAEVNNLDSVALIEVNND